MLNINAINTHKEITPLYSKAYSYEMGALSSNNEIKKAVRTVKSHLRDKGYGLRWKIEEYHRHVKQQYGLEAVQIKTFEGIQSMLAVLAVAMYILHKKIKGMHFELLLDAGNNYLNKNVPRELGNFI